MCLGWVCWWEREKCDEICALGGCVGRGCSSAMKYMPGMGVLVGKGAVR